MNKIFIFIQILILYSNYSSKYESSYYKNTTNILEKYPKIDIDYIFSKPEIENNLNEKNEQKETKEQKEQKEQNDLIKNKNLNNPSSNIFLNTFYDYYETSVPLYEEKMKCFFPMKKNISLDINDTDTYNTPKIKNISKYYGKSFIKSLKGTCERFYIERWYYTLCPLIGAKQTLSYIQPNENKKKGEEEKQEVNYLGYELEYNEKINDTIFVQELYGDYKKYAEKKYHDEIMDIKDENMFNNYGKKNRIIGIYKNLIKFFGNNAFDSKEYSNYSKSFILEYKTYSQKEKHASIQEKTFKTNIIKVINNNIILVNETLDKADLLKTTFVKKIKILKNKENSDEIPKNLRLFFNQSFFVYDEYLYTSKLNLAVCSTVNCYITISNDNNVYKLDTVVDTKFAILDKGIGKKNDLSLYNKDINYLIFFGDDKLYFLGKGEVDELTEETDASTTFILKGQNLELENSDEILIPFNDTNAEFYNFIFINDIFNNKFFTFEYKSRINQTHHKVQLVNKSELKYLEKEITLDGRYIIIKENKNDAKKEEESKEEAKYVIIGNDKNISLDNDNTEKKEKLKIKSPKEEFKAYRIPGYQESVFNFDLYPYNYNLKDSFLTICFSNDEKCKQGEDYEMLIDIKNEGIIMQKKGDESNKNNSLIYSKFKFKNVENIIKSSIIYFNSTIYFNSIYKEENNLAESEIKLKYKIKNESYAIKYIIINKNKSNNIYIDNINFEEYVSFGLFKNIFLYEQKFLLDDKTIYVDTFENGDYCQPIKAPRRVIVYYSCDEEGIYELKLTNVFEDKKNICVYHYYAKSKFLCNPNTLMKNYIQSSGLKTYCYLDN